VFRALKAFKAFKAFKARQVLLVWTGRPVRRVPLVRRVSPV
jgi:hypothetical protein